MRSFALAAAAVCLASCASTPAERGDAARAAVAAGSIAASFSPEAERARTVIVAVYCGASSEAQRASIRSVAQLGPGEIICPAP